MMKSRGNILLGDKKRRGRSRTRTIRKIRFVSGFIVIAVIALIATIANEERTRIRQAQIDVSRIGHAARLFRADFGRCPIGINELINPPGRPSYVDFSDDPWGRPYNLQCPAYYDLGSVAVVSGGPDGDRSGRDNISSF